MRKYSIIVQKCGRDRFFSFRALEWALQNFCWIIDWNFQDY